MSERNEIEKWEQYYEETARKDFERWIYQICDAEDRDSEKGEGR